jgi:hydrogenase nickel incorporation protein HypA/HybF
MHEWALAEAVISSALDFSKENRLKEIKEITVALGELQQIDREVFDFALKEIMKSKGLDFRVVLRRKKSLLKCKRCNDEWSFDSGKLGEQEKESIHFIPELVHDYQRCPKCGSPDFKILKGRGVWLDSIKGD